MLSYRMVAAIAATILLFCAPAEYISDQVVNAAAER